MAVNWTNNFNDEQSTDTSSAGLSGDATNGATTVSLSSFELTDTDGNGYANWRVNDTFYVTGSASTLYTISTIGTNTNDASWVTFSPGIVEDLSSGTLIYKEDQYMGNHGSAANHLRLRNQGQI